MRSRKRAKRTASRLLDEYLKEKKSGGPNKGWQNWCRNEIAKADFILVVASPKYYAAYNSDHPPGTAPGIIPEIRQIQRRMRDESFEPNTIRPVVLLAREKKFVPDDLYDLEHFGPGGATKVVAWIIGGDEGAPAGEWPPVPPPLVWMVADCDGIRSAFAKLLVLDSPGRILLIKGGGRLGKTTLTEELTSSTARLGAGPLAARLDLKSGLDVHSLLGAFARKLGLGDTYTSTEAQAPRDRLTALFDDLEERGEATVLVFDSFDSSGALGQWVEANVLPAIRAPWLRVVIAGREVPDSTRSEAAEWRDLAERHILEKLEWNDWSSLAERMSPQLTGDDLKTVHKLARGDHQIIRAVLMVNAPA